MSSLNSAPLISEDQGSCDSKVHFHCLSGIATDGLALKLYWAMVDVGFRPSRHCSPFDQSKSKALEFTNFTPPDTCWFYLPMPQLDAYPAMFDQATATFPPLLPSTLTDIPNPG